MNYTNHECTTVADFYEGKSVFITGVTGFLGKVLLEKLLYSCPGIRKIYVLMRAKKGESLNERVEKITNSLVFERLKSSRPVDLNKVVPVEGDLSACQLGLGVEDQVALFENVSVVFHSAATLYFNDPLRAALDINLEGTARVLELCKSMRHIQALVYVSTAYSNTDQRVVEERVYPPAMNIADIYEIVKLHGDGEETTKRILNGRPNTYCFSKFLAEAYLEEHHGDIPTIILRPSIVVPAMSEPMEGWVDTWQSNTIALATTARGLHRIIMCDGSGVVDLIPVDYVVNMAIVATLYSRKGDVLVYNCCTSDVNPITWQRMFDLFLKASKADHCHKLPFPGALLTSSRVMYAVLALLVQTIPAYLMDAWRWATGRRTKYVHVKKQLTKLRNYTQYFATNTWVMRCDRACALAATLTGADARHFPCHPANLHWSSYMPVYYRGVKRFLFRDK